jgi:hypothetical protein
MALISADRMRVFACFAVRREFVLSHAEMRMALSQAARCRRTLAAPSGDSVKLPGYAPQAFQERLAEAGKLALQALRAIAVLASPEFRTVVIPALPAVVRILHFGQLEILLPVRALLLEGSGTIADLNPAGGFVFA